MPLDKAVVMDCPMVAALEDWLDQVVQPAAMRALRRRGRPSSTCSAPIPAAPSTITPGQKLSEHAFGNAVDVSGFGLADGRKIVVVRDWKRTDTQESAFLHEAAGAAPAAFSRPCSGRAPMRSTTTTSTWIWRCTGAPTPARAAIAGRRLRPSCCRRPASGWTSPPPRRAQPVDLHGPDFAVSEKMGTQESELVAPVLPPEDVSDQGPTSASHASDDE